MTDIILKKLPGETETQFVYRLACARADGLIDMTWEELTEVYNRELGKNRSSSSYRKPYQNAQRYMDELLENNTNGTMLEQLRAEKQEIREQMQRCHNCGIPFCHGAGCPLFNQRSPFLVTVTQAYSLFIILVSFFQTSRIYSRIN